MKKITKNYTWLVKLEKHLDYISSTSTNEHIDVFTKLKEIEKHSNAAFGIVQSKTKKKNKNIKEIRVLQHEYF